MKKVERKLSNLEGVKMVRKRKRRRTKRKSTKRPNVSRQLKT
jgi:hypothetical protein